MSTMQDTVLAREHPGRAGNFREIPRLVVMTDDDRLPDPSAVITALPTGSAVILRSRTLDRQMQMARDIRGVCAENGIAMLISCTAPPDRLIGDGVHVPEAARKNWRRRDLARLSPEWITTSAHSLASVADAAHWGADAVLLSPILTTQSHEGGRALGWWRAASIRRYSSIPVLALGGIEAGALRRSVDLGFDGIAGIGIFK